LAATVQQLRKYAASTTLHTVRLDYAGNRPAMPRSFDAIGVRFLARDPSNVVGPLITPPPWCTLCRDYDDSPVAAVRIRQYHSACGRFVPRAETP